MLILSLELVRCVWHRPLVDGRPLLNLKQYNSTFLRALHTFLNTAGLEHCWWGEVAHTAIIVYNLLLHLTNPETCSPMEMWTGEAPCLDHIHVFGCLDVLVPSKQCDKLDDCSHLAIYLGPVQSRVYHRDAQHHLQGRSGLHQLIQPSSPGQALQV